MSDRMRQVNEEVHHTVAEILSRDIELPLDTFVTVTHVLTSRDLKHATVFVTILPDAKRISTITYIEKRLGRIQHVFGKHVSMKYTPKLRFQFDEGEINAQKIYDKLDTE